MFQLVDQVSGMDWRWCLLLVASAGAVGGLLNAFFTDHGLKRPSFLHGIWCPGAVGNVTVGAVSALVSWALYGSGAGVQIASSSPRQVISLRLGALAGALMVGIAGARWLSNEVDKALLKESVIGAAEKELSPAQCERLRNVNNPQDLLKAVTAA
jgi:hypothetical protein